jgi:ATP-dependent RNA circularization protein (DNA/RNA ligase family)
VTGFFRFPHTPHIAWLGTGEPRDDKVLATDEATQLLAGDVVLEEKLDGANLGFSLSSEGDVLAQNRGQYLGEPYAGQFARLPDWLARHGEAIQIELMAHIQQDLILFGEWCAARHSLDYESLPDWFLLFDVFERSSGQFWSSVRRNNLARQIGLKTVPQVHQGQVSLAQIKTMLTRLNSQFRPGPVEGLVIRQETPDHCTARAKLVRSDFTQAITNHWRDRRIEWNRLCLT